MAWKYRGRQRYSYEVCARCYQDRPNDQELTSKKCYFVTEHRICEKIYVTPVNDRELQVVRPRPVLLPEGKWFALCYRRGCTRRCTYAHSEVEREVWNTELFYYYRDVSLPRNVSKESAHTTPRCRLQSLHGTSLPRFGSKVRHLTTDLTMYVYKAKLISFFGGQTFSVLDTQPGRPAGENSSSERIRFTTVFNS